MGYELSYGNKLLAASLANIYVAGKNIERARSVMRALQKAGHTMLKVVQQIITMKIRQQKQQPNGMFE